MGVGSFEPDAPIVRLQVDLALATRTDLMGSDAREHEASGLLAGTHRGGADLSDEVKAALPPEAVPRHLIETARLDPGGIIQV